MPTSLQPLCDKLGYEFRDLSLLQMALTHRSFGRMNNERLEFLGDSLLNFCIAEKLYQDHPHLSEGGLSRLRANLVNGEVLAVLAKELTISDYLRLGPGEMKSGGLQRKSILSNTMEAIIGAVFLDGGIEVCRQRILHWFIGQLQLSTAQGVKKDPKTSLQEYLQAKKYALPQYKLLSVEGREQNQNFKIECRVPGLSEIVIGQGSNRRRAEQNAAEQFLHRLRVPI